MKKTTVKIYGYGWVGRSMKTLFPEALVYDPAQGMLESKKADVAFVCVPTPNLKDGSLDTSIVEEVVSESKEKLIVIRSTVNPGTTDYLSKKYKKHVVMQPEFLGETPNHPMSDQKARQWLILGGQPKDRRTLIDLYTGVYNANTQIVQVTAYEAEVIKLSENRAISFKVAQCQELYDACEKAKIDYYTIRDAVYGADPRFNLWWTFVFRDQRGFNSKCIPKDVFAWAAWAESLGYSPKLTRALLNKNKEWLAQNEV